MSAFTLRKATWDDAGLLLEWANDEDTRRNSFHTDIITWDEHCAWLKRCLNDADTELYICCKGNEPVGQVRLNCEGRTGIISYSIAKEFRGQGIGGEIIRLIEERAAATRPHLEVLAGDVKPENLASQKIFERNGYVWKRIDAEKPYFEYSKAIRPDVTRTIGIRVDANDTIATGHMMRCLSIAAVIRKQGRECVFFVADGESARLAEHSGCDVVVLGSQWDDLDGEVDALTGALRGRGIGALLIDSYYVTARYLQNVRECVKTAYIDDLDAFVYPVNMLINYNIYSGLFDYPERYRTLETQLLLGCGYAPLREEFADVRPQLRETVKKVLVTMGGADPCNAAGWLLERLTALDEFSGIEFHAVVGRLNAHADMLQSLAAERRGIVLHRDVQRMSALMMDCDVAVTAGGTTLYELCACGLPSITLAIADNQLHAVKGFERAGLMPCSGDLREDEEKCLAALAGLLREYIGDPRRRREAAARMREMVDGGGAARIAQAVASL